MGAPNGNRNRLTHGLAHTRIDNIYKAMVSRCYSKKNNRYARYGERGIAVCDEWLTDKRKFFEWAFANGYDDSLTLDRFDVNKGYSADNCRWVTQKEQQNNRSNNVHITLDGETHTISEWADITGIRAQTLWARLKMGWSIKRALTTTPIIGRNRFH